MSSKRFILLFTAASLALYILASAGVTVPSYYEVQRQKAALISALQYNAEISFASEDTPEEGMLRFSLGAEDTLQNDIPYIAAVFDTNGTLLAKTHDMLVASPHTAPDTSINVDLEPYITEDIRWQITAFALKAGGTQIVVKDAAFVQRGGAYIPVRLTLGYDDLTNRSLVFTFFETEENVIHADREHLFLYDVNGVLILNQRLKEMHASLAQAGEQIRATGNHSTWIRGVSSYSFGVMQGGRELRIVILLTLRPIAYALKLAARNLLAASLIIFFVYTAALIISLRNRRSRAQLAHSRHSFLSAAAHELKTPIAVIIGAGECIAENFAPEKNADYAQMILHESSRMKDMVEQMLRQNRFLSAESVTRTHTELAPLLQRETAAYQSAAAQKEITLSVKAEEELYINCDPEMLAVALQNFLNNAVKYAPVGAAITVSAKREGKRVRVCVHNTGSRISPEAQPHVWEELYREDRVRGDGAGSGLGLSICRRIFELHRFSYGCTSSESGTAFFFTAPAKKPVSSAARKRLPSPSDAYGWAAASLPLVLVGVGIIIIAVCLKIRFLGDTGLVFVAVGLLSGMVALLLSYFARRDGSQVNRRAAALAVVSVFLSLLSFVFFNYAKLWWS